MRHARLMALVPTLVSSASHGFVVESVAIQAGATLEPTRGAFVNTGAGVWIEHGSSVLVAGGPGVWSDSRSELDATSFLALDERGGADDYSLVYSVKGPPFQIITPRVNAEGTFGAVTLAGTPGVDAGILDDGSAILGGAAGVAYGPGDWWGGELASAVSTVNGRPIDSMFIGNLVLTDPAAEITGADLVVRIDGRDVALPLDGSAGTDGYRLEQERDRVVAGGRELFVVVPGPGVLAAGALGLAGATRRRR
jgi:hypothetical protein